MFGPARGGNCIKYGVGVTRRNVVVDNRVPQMPVRLESNAGIPSVREHGVGDPVAGQTADSFVMLHFEALVRFLLLVDQLCFLGTRWMRSGERGSGDFFQRFPLLP